LTQPASLPAGAGEDHRGPWSHMVSAFLRDKRMLNMTDHIMKTLLNIMAALSLGAFMILFIVL
jgi:hypothetical protein